MTEQLAFDETGKLRRVPTRLTEDREAWEPKPMQLSLDDWGRDTVRLREWNEAQEGTT